MAGEEKKDFNAMLRESKGMPRIQLVTDEKPSKNMEAVGCTLRRLWPMTRP